MATAAQVKSLVQSYYSDDKARFSTVTLQIAAHEAKLGHTALAEELRQIVNKSSFRVLLTPVDPEVKGMMLEVEPVYRLKDLVVEETLMSRIQRVIDEYRKRNTLLNYGLTNRRKLMLIGAPGTGKTMTAEILAKETGLPLRVVLIDKIVSKYLGESSEKLRKVFSHIAQYPAVYLFDEFDAIGLERTADNEVGEIRRVLNSFLQFLEQDSSSSIILCATNNFNLLDQALYRRYDDILTYELPNSSACKKLLENRLGEHLTAKQIDSIINEINGLSQAEITRSCLDAIKESVMSDSKLTPEMVVAVVKERKSIYSKK